MEEIGLAVKAENRYAWKKGEADPKEVAEKIGALNAADRRRTIHNNDKRRRKQAQREYMANIGVVSERA